MNQISVKVSFSQTLVITPHIRGRHKLHIKVDGADIYNSPFNLMAYMNPQTATLSDEKLKQNLNMPYQVVFTSQNHMLVTHEGGVMKIHESSYTSLTKDQSKSTGIAIIDEQDNVYVGYESKGCIVKFDAQGNEMARIEDGTLKRPGRLRYYQDSQQLFVCERGGVQEIQVFDRNLKLVTKFAEGIRCADIVRECTDGNTTYYVSNKNGNNIEKYGKDYKYMGRVFQ